MAAWPIELDEDGIVNAAGQLGRPSCAPLNLVARVMSVAADSRIARFAARARAIDRAGATKRKGETVASLRGYPAISSLAFALGLVGGCGESSHGSRDILPEAWRVVLELPNEDIRTSDVSSDGTLIVVTNRRIIRLALSGRRESSSALAGVDAINAMRAVTNDSVFILGRECGSVFLVRGMIPYYQEGSAQLVHDYPGLLCVHLYSVDADSPRNIWVVGSHATILHYDGGHWRREANPLESFVGDPTSAVFGTYFWSVSASGGEAVIAAMRRLLVRRNGVWDTLPPLKSSMPASCGFRAASFIDATIVAGGGTPACLARFDERGWTDESAKVSSFRDIIFRGSAVGDTAALMWSPIGDVALITRHDVRVFHSPAIRPFVSAHLVNDSLLLVGQHRRAGVVVQISLDD